MPKLDKLNETPRKDLHIFYVLDTSGSMMGAKISALNHAIEESLATLKTLAKSNGDARLKVAVLQFNTGCSWVTKNGPEDLEEDFVYDYLQAGGLTDVGTALKELSEKLSPDEYLGSMMGALMPIIIFMSDGLATDNFMPELEKARQNRWFARATKIGFALGDDADVKMIASVVGNSEAVIKTSNLDLFERLIRFVTVHTSTLRSQSATTETETTGKDIVEDAKKELEITSEISVKLNDNEYSKEPDPPLKDDGWDKDGKW